MTTAEASELVNAKPFRPFAVEMNDGRRFEVASLWDVLVTPPHLVVLVDHDPETGIAETFELLGLEYITAVAPLDRALAA